MTSWPGYDNECDSNNRANNICDDDAVFVDQSLEWDNYAGNSGFRKRELYITKQLSDLYRFNSRFRLTANSDVFANYTYQILPAGAFEINCTKYSSRLWNNIINATSMANYGVPETWWPNEVYNAI